MSITKLKIQNIRNIKGAELETDSPFIVVHGDNGAGKTSVLEAIYLLFSGRSFRTREPAKLISISKKECLVTARHNNNFVGARRVIGENPSYRLDGEATTLADIVRRFPIMLFDNSLFELFEGPPKERRQLLDWALFHVKQDFYICWKQYQHVLRQRNRLLKQPTINSEQLDAWDLELIRFGNDLHEFRQTYAEQLRQQCLNENLLSSLNMGFDYFPGWNNREQSNFSQSLRQARSRDIQQKRTTVGPHHADFKISLTSKRAGDVLSRGQKKLAGFGIKLAQVKMYNEQLGKNCILLCDDFSAELDKNNQRLILEQLQQLGSQVFITLIDPKEFLRLTPAYTSQYRLFHVKQGEVKPVAIA